MSGNLTFLDNSLILIYFAVVLFIGLFLAKNKDHTPSEYFLAGKSLGWIAIGASLFATNISSEHLFGLAGAGSIHGFSVGHFEWLAAIILLLLGWYFAPILLKADVYTMPQFFGKRFDDKSRIYLTIVSIFTYLFAKVAVTLLAGSFVLREVLGWDMFTAAILIVLLTGLYTVIGGMYSVVYTQMFQTVALILGAFLLSLFGLIEIGGFSVLTEKLSSDYFQIIKPNTDPNYPWSGILLGAPILGIWYWCADQYIVQRIFSAKGLKEARKGTILASILKIFPIFFLIFPGLIAAILYPNLKGDSAYSMLLGGSLLPSGIKGLVIIGFFAALMSSLSSSFNSAASLVALDIYRIIKPKASSHEIVLVGRLSTMFFVIAAISIIPILKLIDTNIYINLQELQAYIAPPIVSVFLLGIFWKKASSIGAIWALVIGGLLGLLRIILSSIDQSNFESLTLLNEFYKINYLHFAVILFFASTFVLIFVSLIKGEYPKRNNQLNSNEQSTVKFSNEIPISSIQTLTETEVKINKTKSEIFH